MVYSWSDALSAKAVDAAATAWASLHGKVRVFGMSDAEVQGVLDESMPSVVALLAEGRLALVGHVRDSLARRGTVFSDTEWEAFLSWRPKRS